MLRNLKAARYSAAEDLISRLQAAPSSNCNIEALMIAFTILGVPYYKYSITGPKALF